MIVAIICVLGTVFVSLIPILERLASHGFRFVPVFRSYTRNEMTTTNSVICQYFICDVFPAYCWYLFYFLLRSAGNSSVCSPWWVRTAETRKNFRPFWSSSRFSLRFLPVFSPQPTIRHKTIFKINSWKQKSYKNANDSLKYVFNKYWNDR